MIGSRKMLLASGGVGDYVARALETNPSHFWPFQGNLTDIAGNAPFTSNGGGITYPAASGPGMLPDDVGVYSGTLGLYEPANNFNANQNTNGWSYGGWFKLTTWTSLTSLMSCYTPTMIYTASGTMSLYPGPHSLAHGITNNTWAHILFIANPVTTKYHCYKNGVQLFESTSGQSMSLTASTKLNVGQYTDSSGRTAMTAAYCGWWKNKALSLSEIQTLAGI